MATGTKRKIPDTLNEEIYLLYSNGVPVSDILNVLNIEHKLNVAERTLYLTLKQIRDIKKEELIKQISIDTSLTLASYKLLQQDLEELAVANRSDTKTFLSIIRELRAMYEFQLTYTRDHETMRTNPVTDNGREELLKELTTIKN